MLGLKTVTVTNIPPDQVGVFPLVRSSIPVVPVPIYPPHHPTWPSVLNPSIPSLYLVLVLTRYLYSHFLIICLPPNSVCVLSFFLDQLIGHPPSYHPRHPVILLGYR